jgi:hypothetical protein
MWTMLMGDNAILNGRAQMLMSQVACACEGARYWSRSTVFSGVDVRPEQREEV